MGELTKYSIGIYGNRYKDAKGNLYLATEADALIAKLREENEALKNRIGEVSTDWIVMAEKLGMAKELLGEMKEVTHGYNIKVGNEFMTGGDLSTRIDEFLKG